MPFAELVRHLERVQPGVYRCAPGTSGRASGLRIERPGVAGHAFVFTPTRPNDFLVTLEDLGETFALPSVDAVETTLRRWAFPVPWTAPAPTDPAVERARLAKIRDGLRARDDTVDVDPAVPSALVAALDPVRLTQRYPWDAGGRLALDTRVVLAEPTPPKSLVARTGCLVAVGPVRRRDPQRIRVVWQDLILANQDHRWAEAPWAWTAAPVPESERAPPGPDGERALAAFDDGRLEEGLALFSVSLAPDLHQVLGGVRIRPPACCAHVDVAWSELLAQVIRSCAPWRFAAAVADSAGRPARKAPIHKLAIFPGQVHSRKACVALTRGPGGDPRLVIETTASNVRLHDQAWRLPLGMELARHGLA